jgi:hypothetical protein
MGAQSRFDNPQRRGSGLAELTSLELLLKPLDPRLAVTACQSRPTAAHSIRHLHGVTNREQTAFDAERRIAALRIELRESVLGEYGARADVMPIGNRVQRVWGGPLLLIDGDANSLTQSHFRRLGLVREIW